jgi:hypothetical protein
MRWTYLQAFDKHRTRKHAIQAIRELFKFMGANAKGGRFKIQTKNLLKFESYHLSSSKPVLHAYISEQPNYYYREIGIDYPEEDQLGITKEFEIWIIAELSEGSIQIVLSDGTVYSGFKLKNIPTPFQNRFLIFQLKDYCKRSHEVERFWDSLTNPSFPKEWRGFVAYIADRLDEFVLPDTDNPEQKKLVVQYLLVRLIFPNCQDNHTHYSWIRKNTRIYCEKGISGKNGKEHDSPQTFKLHISDKLVFTFQLKTKALKEIFRTVLFNKDAYDFDINNPFELIQSYAILPDLFYNTLTTQLQAIRLNVHYGASIPNIKVVPISVYRFILLDFLNLIRERRKFELFEQHFNKYSPQQFEDILINFDPDRSNLSTNVSLNDWLRPMPFHYSKWGEHLNSNILQVRTQTMQRVLDSMLDIKILCLNTPDYASLYAIITTWISVRMIVENIAGLIAFEKVLRNNLTIVWQHELDKWVALELLHTIYSSILKYENSDKSISDVDLFNLIQWKHSSEIFSEENSIQAEINFDLVMGKLPTMDRGNSFAHEVDSRDIIEDYDHALSLGNQLFESATTVAIPFHYTVLTKDIAVSIRENLTNLAPARHLIQLDETASHSLFVYYGVKGVESRKCTEFVFQRSDAFIDKLKLNSLFKSVELDDSGRFWKPVEHSLDAFYAHLYSIRKDEQFRQVRFYRGACKLSESAFLLSPTLANEILTHYPESIQSLRKIVSSGDIFPYLLKERDYFWFTPDPELLTEMRSNTIGLNLLLDCQNSLASKLRSRSDSAYFTALPYYTEEIAGQQSNADEWIVALGNLPNYPRAALFPRNTNFYDDCIIIDSNDPLMICALLNSFIFRAQIKPYYYNLSVGDADVLEIIFRLFPFNSYSGELADTIRALLQSELNINSDSAFNPQIKLKIDLLLAKLLNISYEWVHLINPEIPRSVFDFLTVTDKEFDLIYHNFRHNLSDYDACCKHILDSVNRTELDIFTCVNDYHGNTYLFDSKTKDLILKSSLPLSIDDLFCQDSSGGYAVFYYIEQHSREFFYGIINLSGNLVLDFFYSGVGEFFRANRFLAIARNEKYNFVNINSKRLSNYSFEGVTDHETYIPFNNFEWVEMYSEGERFIIKVGLVDFEDNLIIPPIYEMLMFYSHEELVYRYGLSIQEQEEEIRQLKDRFIVCLKDFEGNKFTWTYSAGLQACEEWPKLDMD